MPIPNDPCIIPCFSGPPAFQFDPERLRMTLTKKNVPVFLLIVALGLVIGSLGWEILERVLSLWGLQIGFTLREPITLFDFYVLSVSLRANLGTILGALGGVVVYRLI